MMCLRKRDGISSEKLQMDEKEDGFVRKDAPRKSQRFNGDGTYFSRRYSSKTVRSFCAGAHSEEKAARLAMLPVVLSMVGAMR